MTVGHGPVVTPSPGLWAVVRHADLPELVPDELVAFVVARRVDGEIVDWDLTDDVVAFGDVDVPTVYQRWRATWERVWRLDPHASVVRLGEVARSMFDRLGLRNRFLLELATADRLGSLSIEDPEDLLELADELELVRDAIRDRDTTGFGFVDATEGRSRTGLALAWSPAGDAEILAADGQVTATMRPEVGLCVDVVGPPPRSIEGVEEVVLEGAEVCITAPSGEMRLGVDDAVALTWVVPGVARWRVRPVPEVLVWARTIGGLVEACRYAAAIRLPVVVGPRSGSAN